jgi:hypothetical protein
MLPLVQEIFQVLAMLRLFSTYLSLTTSVYKKICLNMILKSMVVLSKEKSFAVFLTLVSVCITKKDRRESYEGAATVCRQP